MNTTMTLCQIYLWLGFKEGWWHHVVFKVGGKHAWGWPLFKVKYDGSMFFQPGHPVPVRKSLNRSWISSTNDQRDDLLHPCCTLTKRIYEMLIYSSDKQHFFYLSFDLAANLTLLNENIFMCIKHWI